MKKTIVFLVILFGTFVPAYTQGDSTWSVYIGKAIYKIFPSLDGKYLFCNQNRSSRFVKINAMTGQIIDSVGGKGLIMAISPDWKYLYTCYSTFESIKKLDINTYQAVDSLDNMQDIQEIDSIHKVKYTLLDMELSDDNRLVLSVGNGKYIFIVLDASRMEILNKCSRYDYSRGLDLRGSDNITISPKLDYFIANYAFTGFDTLTNIGYNWNETWVWDYKTLKPIKKIFSDWNGGAGGDRYPLQQYKFSPAGKYFGESRGKFFLYNTIDFSIVKEFIYSQAFTFDSKNQYLCIDYSGLLRFINLNNYFEQCSQSSYYTFALSPDDRFFYGFSAASGYLTKSRTCIYPVGVTDTLPLTAANLIFDPVSNELSVKDINLIDAEYEYRISDINGNIIRISSIFILDHQFTINIGFLLPGVYFLTIDKQTFKFSIVR